MLNYFLVAAGGAAGSVLRFWISTLMAQRLGETFPWGTLVVNVTGSFLIGVFAAWFGSHAQTLSTRAFLMVGICGGYTTFSSFSLQTLYLIRDGNMAYAALNIFVSVAACLVAVWLGHAIAAR